jgi:DNA processing protein
VRGQPLSPDAQAIVLSCSAIASGGDRSLKPLTAIEWHNLSMALREAALRPGDLLGKGEELLRKELGLSESLSSRLAALLDRGGQLALELERLDNRGIWILTRADENYPVLLKKRLHRKAPPVLFGAGAQSTLSLQGIAVVGSRDVGPAQLEFATDFGIRCAGDGFTVISGAARGVDAAAMRGAIERGGLAVGITVDPLEKLVSRREFRSPIAEELLTLATPFHPAARWQAGNAMSRNRIVYALSCAALVVASSTEKGGTRAGALENLKAGWVPLYVRDDGSEGNRRLTSEGGRPLTDAEALKEGGTDRLVVPAQATLTSSEEEAPPPRAPVPSDSERPDDPLLDDAFIAIWPHLARHLVEPRTEREVADRLRLELKQAREWLKRAAEMKEVEVLSRPKRYVIPQASSQQSLIKD